ncbi:MAG: zinc ribbon domain-containing protein [Planctomycetaceae bacterium]|jgi:hypothetical protein|nr:zinc ribbon domain-containing protein [Planctomycetaceae bacterium]MDG2389042.1 zinc ribbon domain-containing protein [Planctomycetaceae bacterium]
MAEPETSLNEQLPEDWEDVAENMPEAVGDQNDISVCPRCFEPIQPHAHLCLNCGGPISAGAMIDPLARIWGEGFGYRQITRVGSQPSLAAVVGVWLIFVPGMLSSLGFFLHFAKLALDYLVVSRPGFAPSATDLVASILGLLLMTFVFAIQIAIVRRVTLNYFRTKSTEQPAE